MCSPEPKMVRGHGLASSKARMAISTGRRAEVRPVAESSSG